MSKLKHNNSRPFVFPAILANLLVFAILGYCYWLTITNKDLYLSIVQEDNYIEWGTTWAFLFASAGFFFGAVKGNNKFKDFQWFYIGLSIFCFLIAMEEISWGQRIFGYLPPNYFLENNYQQEFTVHNIFNKSFRIITLKVIILGYGIILPLLMLIPTLRNLLNSLRIVVAPIELIPAFLSVFYVYHIYPWEYTGEVIEFMLAMCFLFTILFRLGDFKYKEIKRKGLWQFSSILGTTLMIVGFSVLTANKSFYVKSSNSIMLNYCNTELDAIKKDFIWGADQIGNSNSIGSYRLYTFVKNNHFNWMYEKQFSELTKRGLPQDRADFFIDPWNMAYWLMLKFDKETGRKRFVVYSFGPNRKRDSDDWAIQGDDIGVIILDTGLEYPYISENEIIKEGN